MAASTARRRYACGSTPISFAFLTEGVEERGHLRASLRLRAVVILAADDGPPESALDGVVVDGYAGIIDEACEPRPAVDHVTDRFAKVAARQADLDGGPVPDSIEDGAGPLLPQSMPLGLDLGGAGKRTRQQPLDGIELPNQRCDVSTGGRPAGGDLVVLPFRVCPAMGEREIWAGAGQHLVDPYPSTTATPR
jgi:hypothetical protein